MNETFEYSVRNPQVPVAYAAGAFMHTECEIIMPYAAKEEAEDAVNEAWKIIAGDEGRFNRHSRTSKLFEVNRDAHSRPVEVDEDTFMALELCQTFTKATGGWFDISANPQSRSEKRRWSLDPSSRTVSFGTAGMRLDLGGFAKGYSLEKVVNMLKEWGLNCALISFGGSSLAALGSHPYGDGWPVGVAHPYFRTKNAWSLMLKDSSMSFSGKDPHGRGHIIDPRSGNIVEKEEIIAVEGLSPMICEVLSTALWIAPDGEREEIAGNFDGYICRSIVPNADGSATIKKIGYDAQK